ncbi:CdaR family protein [Pradoshia sp.]
MDKITSSGWFMKIGAFVVAFMLFMQVNSDPDNITNTQTKDGSTLINDVPVEIYYDTDNLIVGGVPDTVGITLEGPESIVNATRNKMDFEIFIDLSDAEIGSQRVPIEVKGLSDKLDYDLTQAFADVDVEEKVTEEYKVEAEFDTKVLGEGYQAGTPVIDPANVEITGAKSLIDQIAVVRAAVNTDEPVTKDISVEATVQAYDINMNKLDVSINPASVNITIDISSPSKEVSLKPVQKGKASEGITIKDVKLDVNKVTIYGDVSVLDDIKEIQIPIDISTIKKDTVLELPVSLPDGVVGSSADTVKVTIDVKEDEGEEETAATGTEESTDTIADIPIEIIGLDEDQYSITFITPEDGSVSMEVSGEASFLESLKASDITISVDITGLKAGEHQVTMNVEVPEEVHWELPDDSKIVTIALAEKNSEG